MPVELRTNGERAELIGSDEQVLDRHTLEIPAELATSLDEWAQVVAAMQRADAPEDATIAAIVRLVNAEGFVVYPNQRRVSGWKYVGAIAKLPARVAQDLMKSASKVKK